MNEKDDKDLTGTTPAGGQQHGSSSGEGGNVGRRANRDEKAHHPRPATPGPRVEDQADQPGVTRDEGDQRARLDQVRGH